jgi:hypothetical protein
MIIISSPSCRSQSTSLMICGVFMTAPFRSMHSQMLAILAGAAILNEFNLVTEPYRSFETSGVTGKASDEQLIVVTDSASNNHSGDGLPSQYVWVPCSDHKIGTVINTVLAKKTMTIDGKKSAPFYEFQYRASEVFEMITQCKELVAYCKKSGLNSMLAPKLKQEIATRWYGLLTMSKAFAPERCKKREED